MLIFGKSVGDWQEKADYAENKTDNEYAKIHEVRCEGIEDVQTAMETMAAFAADSKCSKFLYHATINLNPGERLGHEQWQRAVETLERNLKLTGHYRVVFEHIKKDRQHYHIVWSRIPPEGGAAVNMGNDYFVHQNTAKALEKEFGLTPAPRRDKSKPSRKKQEIHDRNIQIRVKPEIVTSEVTRIFRDSRTAEEFVNNLAKSGYVLTRAKNDSYVIVDKQGGYHGLMRRIEGAKLNDLREKFPDLEERILPSLSSALKARRPAPSKDFASAARSVGRSTKSVPIRPSHAGYKPAFYIPPRPNLMAIIAVIRSREEKKKPGRKSVPWWKRRRRKKFIENEPFRPNTNFTEIQNAEALEYAWHNKRFDMLRDFGIILAPDFFEP
jgi:hypothetical protein